MDGEIPGRKSRTKKVEASPKNVDFESIFKSKQQREFQLLMIYIVVVLVISLSWVIGYFQYSFSWLMILFILTLSIWRQKVFEIVRDHIALEQVIVHRKRALRGSETAEWINFLLNRWVVFSSPGLSELMKRKLNPVLLKFKPSILEEVSVKSFTLGDQAPSIQHIQVFEMSDGLPGGRKQASWFNVSEPPKELNKLNKYQIVMDMEAGMHCEQFKMVLKTKLAGLPGGPDILVENLKIQGRLHVIPTISTDVPFPHFSRVSLSFVEKPDVWFSAKILKTFQVMDIPLLKSWIHNFVMDLVCFTLVDPYKFDFDVGASQSFDVPTSIPQRKPNAKGVLTVTVKGDPTGREHLSEDSQYCQVKLGQQSYSTEDPPRNQSWQDTCSFLVHDVKTETLVLKVKSRRMLSCITLASYDIKLGNYAFDMNNNIEALLDEKEADLDMQLTLILEYTPLSAVTLDSLPPTELQIPPSEVAGVVYVHIHGGFNLLALDKSGTSDPYCVLYANRKKISSTHFVYTTRNPKWDSTFEFFVEDFTKTAFTFLLYDWDMNEACDDDFMGAAHLTLSLEEPCVTHKSLNLGYNILNIGEVTHSTNFGSILVSAVFRPVESVKRSENSRISIDTTPGTLTGEALRLKDPVSCPSPSNRPRITRQHSVRTRFPDSMMKRSPRKASSVSGPDINKLLSQGHDVLELHIIKARDLMAMDKNGFSDPFCIVKVGREKKFQTAVKKKTLDPIWDEAVTTQMPEGEEKLEILVWDRDPLMRKDFLGSISFTADEIKRLSNIDEPGWFLLQKTKSGQVQVQMKVITEDMKGCLDELANIAATEVAENQRHFSSTSDSSNQGALMRSPVTSISEGETEEEQPFESSQEREKEVVQPNQNSELYATLPKKDRKKKPGLFSIKRSSSDVQVDNSGKFRLFRSKTHTSSKDGGSRDQLDGNPDDFVKMRHSESMSSLEKKSVGLRDSASNSDKYFDVRGYIEKLALGKQTVGAPNAPVYCKIRVDSRTESQRSSKFSPGRLLSKTPAVKLENEVCALQFPFEVDRGGGIPADTLLILDVKSTQRNQHIATKGYTLKQLFDDSQQMNKWIDLENDVRIYLEMSCSIHHPHPKRPFSMLSFGSRKRKDTSPLLDHNSTGTDI